MRRRPELDGEVFRSAATAVAVVFDSAAPASEPAIARAGIRSRAVLLVGAAAGGAVVIGPPNAEWDAGDMGCGEIVMKLRAILQPLAPGDLLKLIARDAGAPEDLPAWCRLTGHKLVSSHHPEYWIQRRD